MQQIELFFACRNLKDKDVFSKSDPFLMVHVYRDGHWVQLGRTETIMNNLNPNFKKTITVDYVFEMKQPIRFNVRDDDGTTSEDLGLVETTIGALFGSKNQTTVLELGKGFGKLIVRCEKVTEGNEFLQLQFKGVKLMNTDGWFGTSDPFLRFLREREDGTFIQVYETDVVMNNLNPQWKPFEILVNKLATTMDRRIKLECWDWEKSGKNQFIGEAYVTVDDLKSRQEIKLINPKKKGVGSIQVQNATSYIKPSFVDYIRGGMQLNLITAVDFTGSNGNPTQPSSLHYRNPRAPNQYQQAIMSVGEILLAYDYDKLVPCFGFGASTQYPYLHSQGQVLHCFPLSGNAQQTDAFGLDGILNLYNLALQHVSLSGPTYFAPIIEQTMSICQQVESDIYTILLILTDGEIHDMEQTKQLIVRSSRLPLSIIIIGVGSCDFKAMEELDGDNGLMSNGKRAERDLVQFVAIRDYHDQVLLAKAVLAEVPQQVVQYKALVGQKPGIAQVIDVNQMGLTIHQQPPPQQPPVYQPQGQQQIPSSYPQLPQQSQQYPPPGFAPFQAPPQQAPFGQQVPGQVPPTGYPPQQPTGYQQNYQQPMHQSLAQQPPQQGYQQPMHQSQAQYQQQGGFPQQFNNTLPHVKNPME